MSWMPSASRSPQGAGKQLVVRWVEILTAAARADSPQYGRQTRSSTPGGGLPEARRVQCMEYMLGVYQSGLHGLHITI
jgi:hypothetical protein